MKIYIYIVVFTLATLNVFAQDDSHEIIWDQRDGFHGIWREYWSTIEMFNHSKKLYIQPLDYNSIVFGFYDISKKNYVLHSLPLPDPRHSRIIGSALSNNDSLLCLGILKHKNAYDTIAIINFYLYDIEKKIYTDSVELKFPILEHIGDLWSNNSLIFSQDCSEIYLFNDNNKLLAKYNWKTKYFARIQHSKAYKYYFHNDSYIRYAGDSARVYDMSGNQIIKFKAEDEGKNIEINYFDGVNILYTCEVNEIRSVFHKSIQTGSTHFIDTSGIIIPLHNNKDYFAMITNDSNKRSYIYYYDSQETKELPDLLMPFKTLNRFQKLSFLKSKNSSLLLYNYYYLHSSCLDPAYDKNGSIMIYDIEKNTYETAPDVAMSEINNLSISQNEEMAINISVFAKPHIADVTVYDIFSGDVIFRRIVEDAQCFAPDNINIICAYDKQITLRNINTNEDTFNAEMQDSIIQIRSQDNYLIISYKDSIAVIDYFDKSITYTRSNNEAELLNLNISNDRIFAATALGEIFVYNLKNSEFESKYQIPAFNQDSVFNISKTAKHYLYGNSIYSADNHESIYDFPAEDYYSKEVRFLGDDALVYLQRGEDSGTYNAFTYNLKTGTISPADHFTPKNSLFVYSSENKITVVQDCNKSVASLMAVRSTVSSVPDAITNDEMLFILPNPAEVEITINFPDAYGNEANVRIIDLLGNVVFEDNIIDKSEIKIDISGFASGMYNVILGYGNSIKYGKFVKR